MGLRGGPHSEVGARWRGRLHSGMRAGLLLFVLLIAAAAGAALRLPDLNARPMHTDEAVHTVKFAELAEWGRYAYDPNDFHGPTLYYLTLPVVWASGAESFAATREWHYRGVTAMAGVALIIAVLLLRRDLGAFATGAAALLTAVSPALVFYSRYYIQEVLLVLFTFVALAGTWRLVRGRHDATQTRATLGWAVLAGAALGLMHATKETAVLSWAALLVAAVVTSLFLRRHATPESTHSFRGDTSRRGRLARLAPLAALVLVAVLLSTACFSVGYTYPRGIWDSLAAYGRYVQRAGSGLHDQPWYYYLKLLAFNRVGAGPIWSDAIILALAAFAAVWTLRPPRRRTPVEDPPAELHRRALAVFLLTYTLALGLLYSAIPYKTPWCVLSIQHGLILLAGIGAAVLWRGVRRGWARSVLVLVLAGGVLQWGEQARRASFRYAGSVRNPYVYAQSAPDARELGDELQQIARLVEPRRLLVQVIAPNPWPLPWYLRGLPRVGYWETLPPAIDGDVILVSADWQEDVAARVPNDYFSDYWGLRRDEVLVRYVRRGLWDAYLSRKFGSTSSAPASRPVGPP